MVEGRLKVDEWDDRATGMKRRDVRIVASQISTVRPYVSAVSLCSASHYCSCFLLRDSHLQPHCLQLRTVFSPCVVGVQLLPN